MFNLEFSTYDIHCFYEADNEWYELGKNRVNIESDVNRKDLIPYGLISMEDLVYFG